MKKAYKILIFEELGKEFIIEASDKEEALSIAKKRYRNGESEYILTSEDYLNTEFILVEEK